MATGFRTNENSRTPSVLEYWYLFASSYFKRQVILKHQVTIEKGYYVNDSTKKYCSTPYLLSRIALRLLKIVEPYLVEQNRMANAHLLGYGSKHLGRNFFFY